MLRLQIPCACTSLDGNKIPQSCLRLLCARHKGNCLPQSERSANSFCRLALAVCTCVKLAVETHTRNLIDKIYLHKITFTYTYTYTFTNTYTYIFTYNDN